MPGDDGFRWFNEDSSGESDETDPEEATLLLPNLNAATRWPDAGIVVAGGVSGQLQSDEGTARDPARGGCGPMLPNPNARTPDPPTPRLPRKRPVLHL